MPDAEYIRKNLGSLIKDRKINRLIICSELKISLALLDDFIYGRLRMSDEMAEKLSYLLENQEQKL